MTGQRDGVESLKRRTTSAGQRRQDPSLGPVDPITLDLSDIAKLEFDLERIARMSPEEQEYYAPMVRKIDELRRRNPLYFWRPHPGVPLERNKQHRVLSIRKRRKGAVGGNRSGKTTVGIADDLIQACDESFLPPHLLIYKKWDPPFICRIVMQDFDVYGERVIYPKVRDLVPRDQLVGGSWETAFSKDLRILRFTNGSVFEFMSYQQDVERFGGAAYHRVHFDEEPPEHLMSEIRRGLIDYGGDELWTMTPLLGLSHSYDELTDDGTPKNTPKVEVVTMDMDDNPTLNAEARDEVLADIKTDAEREARKKGRFVHFAGRIYPFDESAMVIPHAPLEPWWLKYEGIDPGIAATGGCGVLFMAITEDDELVVYDEIFVQGKSVKKVSRHMIETRARHRIILPEWTVIDPNAQNKNRVTGRSEQHEWTKHGIVTILGQNNVPAGINKCLERIEDGRLKVMANCVNFIREIKRYRWKPPPRNSQETAPDRPVKKDDHLMDPWRYLEMSEPTIPDPQDYVDPADPYAWAHAAIEAEIARNAPGALPRGASHGGGIFA